MKRRSNIRSFRRKPQRKASSVGDVRLIMMIAFAGTLIFLNQQGDAPSAVAEVRTVISGQAGSRPDQLQARFGLCHSGGGGNCVVDGDTFWFAGEKIRIADIDTPETHSPRCVDEARLGATATDRLQTLLNDGPFMLESADRDTDRYGRALRIVTRDGESVGGVLVGEGLARWYDSGRQPWC